MNQERYTVGSTARLLMELIDGSTGLTAESPTVAIQRDSDGLWLDAANEEFVPTIVENDLVELDPANLPGLYYFDFDHTVDTTAAPDFTVRFRNTGTNARLEYRRVSFGTVLSTAEPNVCTVTGTVLTADGERAPNSIVRGTIIPVQTDSLGRGYQNLELVETYTDSQGEFELAFVRGLDVRLEIPDIGYDRRVTIPDQATALFTDL